MRYDEIKAYRIGRQAVLALYRGPRLLWQAVRSCFGSGRWTARKPWLSAEKWNSK